MEFVIPVHKIFLPPPLKKLESLEPWNLLCLQRVEILEMCWGLRRDSLHGGWMNMFWNHTSANKHLNVQSVLSGFKITLYIIL